MHHRWMRRTALPLLAVLALFAGACGGDDDAAEVTTTGDAGADPDDGTTDGTTDGTDDGTDDGTTDGTTDGTDDGAGADGATVAVASSDLGDILVDGEGMTLYAFVPDDQGEPTCTGDCLDAWPVLAAPAEAGEGADGALLGTAEHPSGTTQVTYNSWPLYYFANDEAPGDTNGQGVGDNWYVVGPDGELVQEASMEETSAGSGTGGDSGY